MHTLIRIAMMCASVGALIWLFWPQRMAIDDFDAQHVLRTGEQEPRREITASVSLSSELFAAPLWYTPPQPAQQPPEPDPKSQPVGYTLIAISSPRSSNEQMKRSAVIYDPGADLIYEVCEGELVGPYVVRLISDQVVELESGQRLARLELELLERRP